MKLFRLKGISKRYALSAAKYRRCARRNIDGLDFSEYALRQLHEYESTGNGIKPEKSKNGYAYGKWLVDLSVSMWIEDIQAGNFCKAEFLSTAIDRIHNRKKLEEIIPGSFFGYDGFSYADYKVRAAKKRALKMSMDKTLPAENL